uniref:Ubiquinone biosynthesis O-methyltransferase, mitochondrial n=1 Tax=Heliothis virescens TaxID=7102 RepID=A0A2A4JEQ5_HELVI
MWSQKLARNILDKTKNKVLKVPQWSPVVTSRCVQSESRTKQSNSTMDSSEVELFSKQMNDWWNPYGKMSLLHSMNLLRVPFVRDGLVNTGKKEIYPLKDKKILDVGCGGGILSEGLARLGAFVTGIDASEELIQVAEEHKNLDPKIAYNKPIYVRSTIEDHAKKVTELYDAVVASEVIEHVQNQELFVKSCVHTLKPGGRIFFTTPNRTRLSQFAVIYLGEYVLKCVPQGAHQFEKFITPTELTFLLERNKCHVELTYGVTFNPVTGRWDFSAYQQLMYAIQAVKLS